MKQDDFVRLIELYANEKLTTSEFQELEEYLAKMDEYDLPDVLAKQWLKHPEIQQPPTYDHILQHEIPTKVLSVDKGSFYNRKRNHFTKWLVAAMLLTTLSATFYFLQSSSDSGENIASLTKIKASGILMTTANGTAVHIDKIKDSVIRNENGSSIHIKNGQIAYDHQTETTAFTITTISTRTGQQYQINLPDGTKVWLNALSSISFPSRFEDKIRKVTMQGEVYFEVARDRTKPFIVETVGKLEIAVLGTHFNINAYHDNPAISTTLVEGQIRLSNGQASKILSPGQQAKVQKKEDNQQLDAAINVVSNVNTDETIAWVNGVFHFNNLTLDQVSKDLERWYDIKVVFQGKIPDTRFMGEMDRGLTLSELRKLLADWGIETRMEGRKMIVL